MHPFVTWRNDPDRGRSAAFSEVWCSPAGIPRMAPTRWPAVTNGAAAHWLLGRRHLIDDGVEHAAGVRGSRTAGVRSTMGTQKCPVWTPMRLLAYGFARP